jgi:hypothetical protein
MFDEYIKKWEYQKNGSENISLFLISEDNYDGINILINNCYQTGTNNENVKIATVHPNLWLVDFLDKYHDKISYVTKDSSFRIIRKENGEIAYKNFFCMTKTMPENELDNFFTQNKFRKLVIHSVTKKVDLDTLQKSYSIRYIDITQKGDERDNKIKEIFK